MADAEPGDRQVKCGVVWNRDRPFVFLFFFGSRIFRCLLLDGGRVDLLLRFVARLLEDARVEIRSETVEGQRRQEHKDEEPDPGPSLKNDVVGTFRVPRPSSLLHERHR